MSGCRNIRQEYWDRRMATLWRSQRIFAIYKRIKSELQCRSWQGHQYFKTRQNELRRQCQLGGCYSDGKLTWCYQHLWHLFFFIWCMDVMHSISNRRGQWQWSTPWVQKSQWSMVAWMHSSKMIARLLATSRPLQHHSLTRRPAPSSTWETRFTGWIWMTETLLLWGLCNDSYAPGCL